MKNIYGKIITYVISIIMICVSFIIPPQGIVDPSVLMSVGILVGSYELLFGTTIKSIHIDKTGVHIETHDK